MSGDLLAIFTYTGELVPQVRMTDKMRRSMRSRWGWDNLPEVGRYLAFKEAIGYAARAALAEQGREAPVLVPVRVAITCTHPMGLGKPWDVANVYKAVEDGMSQVIYKDDKQVVHLTARMRLEPGEEAVDVAVWEA